MKVIDRATSSPTLEQRASKETGAKKSEEVKKDAPSKDGGEPPSKAPSEAPKTTPTDATRRVAQRRIDAETAKEVRQQRAHAELDGGPRAVASQGPSKPQRAFQVLSASLSGLQDRALEGATELRDRLASSEVVQSVVNPARDLDEPGESRTFEVDLEAKAVLGRSGLASLGVKAKPGVTASVTRREDGDLDLSVEQRVRIVGTGDVKAGQGKVGAEPGSTLRFTQTYATSDAELPARWGTVAQGILADGVGTAFRARSNPIAAEAADRLLSPKQDQLSALEKDRSETSVEVDGYLRTQIAAKYGQVLGLETTARDDWAAGVELHVQHPRQADDGTLLQEGELSLSFTLDNDVSLKNGLFAQIPVGEAKLQELSDVEGNTTRVTLTWEGRQISTPDEALKTLEDLAGNRMPPADRLTLSNRVESHELVSPGEPSVAVDGTHSPFLRRTNELTVAGLEDQDLPGLMRGDPAAWAQAEVEARETVERFSAVGPDVDLKPELKFKAGVGEISVAAEVETFGTELEGRSTQDLSPKQALANIAAGFSAAHTTGPAVRLAAERSVPATAEPAKARPLLGLGAQGEDVREVQSRLDALGYNVAVDGAFGPETDGAVRRFQADRNLDVDGLVGPNTWRALNAVSEGPKAPQAAEEPAKAEPQAAEEPATAGPQAAEEPAKAGPQAAGEPAKEAERSREGPLTEKERRIREGQAADPRYGLTPEDEVTGQGPQRVFRDRATQQYLDQDFDGLKGTLRGLANLASTNPGTRNAGRLLNHYLNNTGDAVRIDYTNRPAHVPGFGPGWISNAPSVVQKVSELDATARQEIERRVAAGQTEGVISLDTTVATNAADDGDSYYALGQFNLRGTYRFRQESGPLGLGPTRAVIEPTFTATDRYDWDPPRHGGFLDHIVPHALEQQGMAQSFDVEVRWKGRRSAL